MCPASAQSLLADLSRWHLLPTWGESQTQSNLLQLTPIGLTLLNNALISFSFSNTFLSLGESSQPFDKLTASTPGSFDPPFPLLIWALPALPALLRPLSWLVVQLAPHKIVSETSALVSAGEKEYVQKSISGSFAGQAINSGVLLHLLLTHLCPLIQPSSLHEAAIVLPTLICSTFSSILLNFWPDICHMWYIDYNREIYNREMNICVAVINTFLWLPCHGIDFEQKYSISNYLSTLHPPHLEKMPSFLAATTPPFCGNSLLGCICHPSWRQIAVKSHWQIFTKWTFLG